jgi:hypothetical protein
LQVEYTSGSGKQTQSLRIAADAGGTGGVRFDPKPKGSVRAKSEASGADAATAVPAPADSAAAAAAAAQVQQQMCDLALKDAGRPPKLQPKQKQSKQVKPGQIYSASFLDQKIAEQQITVEVRRLFSC